MANLGWVPAARCCPGWSAGSAVPPGNLPGTPPPERPCGREHGVLDAAELTAAITQFFTSPDPDAPGNLAFGRR